MVIDIVKFFFLLTIVFFIFAFGGMLAFKKVTQFSSFTSTLSNLITYALGNISFSIYDSQDTQTKVIGYIYIIVFIILMVITLLNFVVAILSNTYTYLKDYSQAIYLREVSFLNDKLGHE